MTTFVSDLAPRPLWKHFDEILKIPRPSGDEEAARQYVLGLAERKGLAVRQDSYGNFVVSKPPSPGHEGAPTVVLQAHLDMVTEKNSDVQHDFSRDPIVPRRDGEWVKATGTTLGADNGIGAAAMLAVLEADDLVHGPLEFLFTVEEETGLVGAGELDGSIVSGRLLLNLDTEEEGEVTIGCAGAANSSLSLPVESAAPPSGLTALEVSVTGLKGGHSGMEIHLPRGNALKLLARALYAVSLERPLHVAAFSGGGKHNAIPREASAVVLVRPEETGAIRAALEKEFEAIRAELRPEEPAARLDVREGQLPERAWTEAAGRRAVALVHALPHGVLSMSQDIPGLVETSTNLAAAAARNGDFEILLSTRSMVDSALRGARQRIRAAAELADASVEENKGYPGWKPDPNAPLLATFRRLHQSITGTEPELKAVHAGLECGVIGDKCPGMQMISFGPRIQGPHSPDERVHVESVERFWKLLVALLKELAE
ncbi:MAG TPA: aminoacyl-histidine dipeptidase [Thermoanaerobaculia bacterium]|nr:aminoacyl-histidine dipeptidase [Thermoanaerobaculia bacterium]